MNTQVSGLVASPGYQEFLPWTGNGAEVRRASVLAARSFAARSSLDASEVRDRWSRVVVATGSRTMVTALTRTAFYHVVAWGMTRTNAERALTGFREYLESVVDGKGTVTLCLGMMVDAVRAAAASGWAPERIPDLLVRLQKELDTGTSSLDDLAATVKWIREGACADKVLG